VEDNREAFERFSAQVRQHLEEVDSSSVSPSLGRRLSSMLEDTQTRWMGTFGSVCVRSSVRAGRARASFRQRAVRRHPAREIDPVKPANKSRQHSLPDRIDEPLDTTSANLSDYEPGQVSNPRRASINVLDTKALRRGERRAQIPR
jgi:hypothetical protein